MPDVYQCRQAFIGLGATDQDRQTRRFVADYVLRELDRNGELADYCRKRRVLRLTVVLLIIEFARLWAQQSKGLKAREGFPEPKTIPGGSGANLKSSARGRNARHGGTGFGAGTFQGAAL